MFVRWSVIERESEWVAHLYLFPQFHKSQVLDMIRGGGEPGALMSEYKFLTVERSFQVSHSSSKSLKKLPMHFPVFFLVTLRARKVLFLKIWKLCILGN